MNQENNNYNQSFNNQPNNRPAQPVKNKFFNFDTNDNSNNVGATTSNGASNVISWGVGKKNDNSFGVQNNNVDVFGINNINGNISNNESYETLDEGNFNKFFQQPNNQSSNEVLEMPKFNNPDVMRQYNGPSSPIFAEAQNSDNQISNNQQGVSFNQQIVSQNNLNANNQNNLSANNQNNQDSGWQNGIGTVNPQGADWMNNQPLSAASLGGATLDSENQPKDVVEKSRFFDVNINNETKNNQANASQFAMQYGNGVGVVLDDPPPVFDELSALKVFVGPNFTKLSMSIFSFTTLIFGSLVFLCRKMYLLGIIFTLIEVGISSFVPFKYAIVALLVLHIILALMVNQMYIKSAKRKVKSILDDKNNMKKNQVEIENLCKKKGKNNLLIAIIIYALCGGMMFAISASTNISETVKEGISSITSKIGKDNNDDGEEKKKENVFDVEEYISITMPKEFIKEDKGYYAYSYVTLESEEDSSCELTIDRIKNVNDVEDYIGKLRDKYNISESVGMNVINDITWYTITNKNDNGKTYYRAAIVQNIPLLLEYKIGANADSKVCETNYSTIVSSIKNVEEKEES